VAFDEGAEIHGARVSRRGRGVRGAVDAPDRYVVTEEQYAADALLVDRYTGYSAELLRVALLLLGALAWFATPGGVGACIVAETPTVAGALAVALLAGVVAAALSLFHRYAATDALANHVYVLRHSALLGTGSDAERRKQSLKVAKGRELLHLQLKRSDWFLFVAAIALTVSVATAAVGVGLAIVAPSRAACAVAD